MKIYNKFFKLSFWGPELSFERQERHQTEHAVLCLHRQGAAVLLHDLIRSEGHIVLIRADDDDVVRVM